jgi:hypothetical protein
MSTTHDRILESASANTELLRTLSETHDAPSSFLGSERGLQVHRKNIKEQERLVTSIRERSDSTLKAHQKYRQPVSMGVRRYFYAALCMKEKYEENFEEKERLHLEALQELKKAEARHADLNALYEEAKRKHEELETLAILHQETHDRLDKLYESVFPEPTLEYPDQDRLKEELNLKVAILIDAKQKYFYEVRVRKGPKEEQLARREELVKASLEAEDARQDLELERERIFEKVAGFGQAPPGYEQAPPMYSSCCNRAEFKDMHMHEEGEEQDETIHSPLAP